ncbi:right-handed parallel beta-helix repeat-containing protein [Treponema sp.]|uniref:right-handed parallel beta-helix repeat-containing protein n=1 Tax=Treponema sp. TaxID=166 RepID=UPI00388F7552
MKVSKILKAAALMAGFGFVMSCSDLSVDSETSSAESSRAATTTVTSESALRTAINNAAAGDTIKLGCNISLTSQLQLLNSGTSSSKINFNGCGYTLDCSGISSGWGVKVNGSYWNIVNMTITKAPDCGIVFQLGGNNYIAYVRTTYNGDSGLQIYNSAHDNYVYKCESYYNYDSDNLGEDADGFACKLSAGKNNVFEGCIAAYNSDDGWDLYGQLYPVTMKDCTAKYNGYRNSSLTTTTNGDGNGFKLGSSGISVKHVLSGCTSNYNLACGYDGNGNSATMSISNCTATGNKKYQWYRISGVSNQ